MRRLARTATGLAAIIALCWAAPGLADTGSWTTFRGPHGTGEAEGLPPGDGPLALELAWKRPLGSGYSGISVAGDRLVTTFTDGKADFVIALEASSGDEIWRYELGPIYKGHGGSHDGPISTPAIAGGRVFALDPTGKVVALALSSGKEIWASHLVDDFGSEAPFYGFASSPVVVDETVILQIGGDAGSVAGFDVASGTLRWRTLEDGVAAQSPIVAELAGRLQVLVMGEKKLAGIDPADGTVLWEFEHGGEGGPMGAMTQSPIPLGRERVFIKYDDPSSAVIELSEVDGALGAYRVHDSRGMARSYSPATLSGDHVFGFTARFLSAVDPADGKLLWRSRAVGDGFLISIGGQLAILEKTGGLHLGTASPEGWSETASLHLFDDLAWTPPSYSAGALYLRSLGEIARVDLVRTETAITASTDESLPAALARLAAAIAASGDASGEVDRFLEGRSLPIIDGESVTFLWRGKAKDVAVAGDMIGMRREEPMKRLEGTDLWWWETKLDSRARISYLFYPDLRPTVDPSHDRVVTATILGPDMNWKRDKAVRMSWFAMPEWPGRGAGAASATGGGGRVETIELPIQPSPPPNAPEGAKTPEKVNAKVDVWLPPGYDDSGDTYPVIYVLNPEAREEGQWFATLDRVVGSSVAPVIVAFPQMPRAPGLRGSLAGQVVPQIDERYRTRTDRGSRALVGMGFPGFSATVRGFFSSEVFGVLGIQSIFFLEGNMKDTLRGAVGDKTAETTPMKIYLEWGRWDLISPHEEMNFRASSKWAWDFLSEKGYEPIGGEIWDSTDHASWANRTGIMLEALFPLSGEEASAPSGLSAWQTSP